TWISGNGEGCIGCRYSGLLDGPVRSDEQGVQRVCGCRRLPQSRVLETALRRKGENTLLGRSDVTIPGQGREARTRNLGTRRLSGRSGQLPGDRSELV